MTCLGQAPVCEHKGRSQALRPHPDLDGYPQTRKWMQTTGDSGLMMLQRDRHLYVMSRSEQCQDGSRNQNQNLQALWPDRNATVTFGEQTCRLHEQALGISTSYFTSGGTFPPHRASLHVGGEWLPCRRWNTGATSPKVSFYWPGETVQQKSTVPVLPKDRVQVPALSTRQLTAVSNSNPRGSDALF